MGCSVFELIESCMGGEGPSMVPFLQLEEHRLMLSKVLKVSEHVFEAGQYDLCFNRSAKLVYFWFTVVEC
jgi:hypothetical protein